MADVRIDKTVASIPEQLTDSAEGSPANGIKLFGTLAEVLVFAALLGKSHGRKKAVQDPRANPVRFGIFENNNLDSYVYLLAISESGGFDLLKDENIDEAIENFESYAFGGLEIVSEWIEASGKGLYESILEQMSLVATKISSEQKEIGKKPIIIRKKARSIEQS